MKQQREEREIKGREPIKISGVTVKNLVPDTRGFAQADGGEIQRKRKFRSHEPARGSGKQDRD